MFISSTTSVAKPLADTLADRKLCVLPKRMELPVGVMADNYAVTVEPDYSELSPEDRLKLKNKFCEVNDKQTEQTTEEFDRLVELMTVGLQRMLTVIRGVIVPYSKGVLESYQIACDSGRIPNLTVKAFDYAAIHSETTLAEHIVTQYQQVPIQESYRSFYLEYPGHDVISQWVQDNKHLSPEITQEWFIGLDEETIKTVWWALFERDRSLNLYSSEVLGKGSNPFNVDSLLLAYLLTIYLTHQPQDVIGESVTLEEWERSFTYLHNYFGAMLADKYKRRTQDINQKRLILKQDVTTPEQGAITVTVNGDLWNQWLSSGGSVQQVLGAVTTAPGRVTIPALDEVKDELLKAWERKHYIYKQAQMERYQRERRRWLVSVLASGNFGSSAVEEELPKLEASVVTERANEYLRTVDEEGLDDTARVVKDLICHVYYPNTPYRRYLDTMDKVARDFPNMSPREAALVSTTEMVARWLADQLQLQDVEDDIRSDFSETSEEVVVEDTEEVIGEGDPVLEVAIPEIPEDESPVAETAVA